jgi:hypothetical protein
MADTSRKSDYKKILRWLAFMLRCPVCSVKYYLKSVKVLESEVDNDSGSSQLLVHSDCQSCKSSVIFNIDIDGAEVFTIAAVTDLTSRDTVKFRKSKPLTAEDCITIHQALKQFNGDFVAALAKN